MRRSVLVCSSLALLAALMLALAPGAGAALPPAGSWQWAQPYRPTTMTGAFQFIAPGPSGSVYAAGDSYAWSGLDWVVSRVTPDGAEVWSVSTLGPAGAGAWPMAVATDARRNLIVAGRCGTRGGDVYVVKYRAADGAVLWQKRWNGAAGKDDTARAVAVDKAGNVLVAGASDSAGAWVDAVVLKYTAGGRLAWKHILSSKRDDTFVACGVDGTGNLYVAGDYDGTKETSKIVTLKLSPTGRKLWQRTVSGLGVNYGARFLRVRGTSVTVVGHLYTYWTMPVILRYTLAGKRTWATASGPGMDWIQGMAVDGKGRVVLVGSASASPSGSTEIPVASLLVYKPGSAWPVASTMFYADFGPGAYYGAEFTDVAVSSTGRMYCAGSMATTPSGSVRDAVVVTYPPIDQSPWTGADGIWRYSGPATGYQVFYGLVRTSDTAVYAAGQRAVTGATEAVVHRLAIPAP